MQRTIARGPTRSITRGEAADSPGFSTQPVVIDIIGKFARLRPVRSAPRLKWTKSLRSRSGLERVVIHPSLSSPASSIALGPLAAM
jgi:hypothetical protein